MDRSYQLFWKATKERKNFPSSINLILPPGSCSHNNYPRTRRKRGSVFYTAAPPLLLQPGGCGEQGVHLGLQEGNLGSRDLENTVLLTRFLYGVFPEHGAENSSRFPAFMQSQAQVELARSFREFFLFRRNSSRKSAKFCGIPTVRWTGEEVGCFKRGFRSDR